LDMLSEVSAPRLDEGMTDVLCSDSVLATVSGVCSLQLLEQIKFPYSKRNIAFPKPCIKEIEIKSRPAHTYIACMANGISGLGIAAKSVITLIRCCMC